MIARRFRHLPVISSTHQHNHENKNGADDSWASLADNPAASAGTNVVGLLDITKCVFERLDDLERKVTEDAHIVSAMDALERRGAVNSEHAGAIKALHGCPDLYAVLGVGSAVDGCEGAEKDGTKLQLDAEANERLKNCPQVTLRASVKEAARVMKQFHHTAVLVISPPTTTSTTQPLDDLSGIFTTKDIVLRVLAVGLDPLTTSVVRVMTPHPDSVSPRTTILDALKKLHVGHFAHLPVIESRNGPVGLVDVLTLTMAMVGPHCP